METVRAFRANVVSIVEEAALTEDLRSGVVVIREAETVIMEAVAGVVITVVVAEADPMVEAVAAGNDSYFSKPGVVISNNR